MGLTTPRVAEIELACAVLTVALQMPAALKETVCENPHRCQHIQLLLILCRLHLAAAKCIRANQFKIPTWQAHPAAPPACPAAVRRRQGRPHL